MAGYELIDTLWNVNSLLAMAKNGKIRINRYIMECKFKSVWWTSRTEHRN